MEISSVVSLMRDEAIVIAFQDRRLPEPDSVTYELTALSHDE
jgi:hypothetical protein